MEIEVETTNPIAIHKLKSATLPPGVSVEIPPTIEQRGLSEAWYIAVFTVVGSVSANMLADFLVKKFGSDPGRTKIRINRRQVEYSNGEIIRVIEETKNIEKQ